MVCTDSTILVIEGDLRFSLLTLSGNNMTVREKLSTILEGFTFSLSSYLSYYPRFFLFFLFLIFE